jgi:peroxiredoxin Q/BCP
MTLALTRLGAASPFALPTLGALTAMAAISMSVFPSRPAHASKAPKVGDKAPDFTVKQDDGSSFRLADRKGQWTVLYFYPKAETLGCTAQACAFRDSIKLIRARKAEVFGVSTDSPEQLAAFRKNHSLNFPLLSDEKTIVAEAFGAKMPLVPLAKRWTFVIDPELVIRWKDDKVDPAKDAANVATKLKELQGG